MGSDRGGGWRAGVGLLLAALLISCGPRETTLYALVDRENDVTVGTEVKLGSSVVGEVVAVDLAPDNLLLLTLRLPADQAKLVAEDARVQVARKGLVVGDRYLQITGGEGGPIAAGDTLQAEPSWWEQQRRKVGDTARSVNDPEFRARLDTFRREVEAAARAGREKWAELSPRLREQLDEIHEYAKTEFPQIAATIYDQLRRLLEEAEQWVRTSS